MIDKVLYAVDENGNRIGESHPRAKVCNLDVEVLRLAYGRGWLGHLTKEQLAEAFGVSIWAIRDIVYYRRRINAPNDFVPPNRPRRKKRRIHTPPPSQIHNLVALGIPWDVVKAMEIEVLSRHPQF